jgi:hypothetical protein
MWQWVWVLLCLLVVTTALPGGFTVLGDLPVLAFVDFYNGKLRRVGKLSELIHNERYNGLATQRLSFLSTTLPPLMGPLRMCPVLPTTIGQMEPGPKIPFHSC